MRIDPKNFSLDANERHVIAEALKLYAAGRTARANAHRRRANGGPISDRSRDIVEQAEMKAARAEDLIAILTA